MVCLSACLVQHPSHHPHKLRRCPNHFALPYLPHNPAIQFLRTQQFNSTLTINLTSHFNFLSIFLRHILSSKNPNGGTIKTLASILSHFSPAHLSAYSASKAGLSSLHHSLTAEIRNLGLSHKVKTILVEPGQIDTSLFTRVETPSRVLALVLNTREVCKVVTGLVNAGEGGVVRLPKYAE
jgi:NAD(P)-dependent dehydrogenase (short-subunit alcohol dehydrogenase family)